MPYVIAILYIVLGIPLAMRAVGPNRWYGVRTAKTLSDSEIWYTTNAVGGKALIVAGAISIIALILLNAFWTGGLAMRGTVAVALPLGLLVVTALYFAIVN